MGELVVRWRTSDPHLSCRSGEGRPLAPADPRWRALKAPLSPSSDRPSDLLPCSLTQYGRRCLPCSRTHRRADTECRVMKGAFA